MHAEHTQDTSEEPSTGSTLRALDDANLDFILQFVLSSGSLKEMARVYGVSYPTLRGRLDRLISRLKEALEGRAIDPMSALLASMIERGELTMSAARSIQETHRKQLDGVKKLEGAQKPSDATITRKVSNP